MSKTRLSASSAWWIIMVVSLAGMFGPGLIEHVRTSANPAAFNDDARQQVVPFMFEERFPDREPDLAASYFVDCMPRGHSTLYRAVRPIVGAEAFSKLLPYLSVGFVLVLLGLAAFDLGGRVALWGTLALGLGTAVLFSKATGGLPRAFAFPVVGMIALGLVRDRPVLTAIATLVGALFYYPAAVLAGCVLAFHTVVSRKRRRGRWILLIVTGVLTILIALPVVRASGEYGKALSPADAGQYPEAGFGGKRSGPEMPGYYNLDQHLVRIVRSTFTATDGDPFIEPFHAAVRENYRSFSWILLAFVVIVSIPLTRADPRMRRLLLLPLGALVTYQIARWAVPLLHLPERYIVYGLPVFFYLVLPAGVLALVKAIRGSRERDKVAPVVAVVLVLVVLLLGGARGPGRTGFMLAPESEWVVLDEIRQLPEHALVAGWPYGVVENVPYLALREVLVSTENHVVVQEEYAREMGARTRALIAAYYASDTEPVQKLRDDYGVTHLLVDRRHFVGEPQWYFEPFRSEMEEARAALNGDPEVFRLAARAAVMSSGPWLLLDLDRLEDGHPPEGGGSPEDD